MSSWDIDKVNLVFFGLVGPVVKATSKNGCPMSVSGISLPCTASGLKELSGRYPVTSQTPILDKRTPLESDWGLAVRGPILSQAPRSFKGYGYAGVDEYLSWWIDHGARVGYLSEDKGKINWK